MRYLHFLILIFSLINLHQLNSKTFEFSGYIYELPSYQQFPDLPLNLPGIEDLEGDWFATNLLRIRLRPQVNLPHNISIISHYEINSFASELQTPINQLNIRTNRQAINLKWLIYEEGKSFALHYFDRLFAIKYFNFGELSVGRQRVSWGVGRIWQPTDLFNPINPANFSKFERDGADVVMYKHYINFFSDLDIVYNFADDERSHNFGARYRTNFNEFDISIMSGYFDNRYVLGGDLAGSIYGVAIRAEGILSANENDFNENFIRGILGADFQFTDKIYAMLEFQYNGEGKSEKDNYELIRLFNGEILNVGKLYLAGQISYRIHELWSVNLLNTTNLLDGSGFIAPAIRYDVSDDASFTFSGAFFYGDTGAEYAYYSTAVFLLAQFYF